MADLKTEIAQLAYPDNHCYDPYTLKPEGKLVQRLRVLEQNAPELFQGGDSFLEIGANKGYFSVSLASQYRRVVGYDHAKEYTDIARQVAAYHKRTNVEFIHGGFREVPFDRRYEIVYVGNCHHYFFFDCAKSYAPPLLFLKKLAGLSSRYLIIDGPYGITDPAVSKLAEKGCWSDKVKALYTLPNHIDMLRPQFELLRAVDNGFARTTCVFRRVEPDVPHCPGDHLRADLIDKGVPLLCNPVRGPDSGFLHENRRFKFDRYPALDAIILTANALPECFPRTHSVIEYRGARVGDVAQWIWGSCLKDRRRLLKHILWLNAVLGSVGLIQTDFERRDFKERDGRIYNVDLDMIRHVSETVKDIENPAIRELMKSKAERLEMKPQVVKHMLDHIGDKWLFRNLYHREDIYADA